MYRFSCPTIQTRGASKSGIQESNSGQRTEKLFKLHFRGSNAINSKVTGSGIGLMLVWKLVRLHKGKINLSSVENQGSVIKVSFPKDSKRFRKAHLATLSKQRQENRTLSNVPAPHPKYTKTHIRS